MISIHIIMKIIVRSIWAFSNIKNSLNRKPFSQLTQEDIEHFRSFMNVNSVITDPQEIEPHN